MNDTLNLIETPILNKTEELIIPEEVCLSDRLTEEEKASIKEFSSIVQFKKGTILTHEGQISTKCYYILDGCVRQYYLINGEEKTTFFYTEEQSIVSSIGTTSFEPSKFFLACVEDTVVSIMDARDEVKLYKRHPRIETMCRISLEQELKKQQEILVTFMISSPEERYLHVLNSRPTLINRVPQYQLASYLGVKPESLSRIRKRIADRQKAAMCRAC